MFGFVIEGAKILIISVLFAAFFTIMGISFCAPPAHAQNNSKCWTEEQALDVIKSRNFRAVKVDGIAYEKYIANEYGNRENLTHGTVMPSTYGYVATSKNDPISWLFIMGADGRVCDTLKMNAPALRDFLTVIQDEPV